MRIAPAYNLLGDEAGIFPIPLALTQILRLDMIGMENRLVVRGGCICIEAACNIRGNRQAFTSDSERRTKGVSKHKHKTILYDYFIYSYTNVGIIPHPLLAVMGQFLFLCRFRQFCRFGTELAPNLIERFCKNL